MIISNISWYNPLLIKGYKVKKLFLIDIPNKTRERQIDSIKNDIRKYIKREKSKKLPIT